jgi:hypothetical protein
MAEEAVLRQAVHHRGAVQGGPHAQGVGQVGVASPAVRGVAQQRQGGQLLLLQVGRPQSLPPWGAHLQGGLLVVVGARAALLLQVLPAAAAAAEGAALLLLVVLQLGAGTQEVRGLHHCCHWPQAVGGWASGSGWVG